MVFASGSGSNFQSILNAIREGFLNAHISGLVVSRDGIGAIEKAKKADIPVFVFKEDDFNSTSDYENALLRTIKNCDADGLILAGYLKKIPDVIVDAFEGKILNIHPSLLPKYGGKGYYGLRVHEAVIANRESETGCTVHIVTKEFDEGPVLAQSKIPVRIGESAESLSKRVLKQEHILYPQVIQQFLYPKSTKK